jgi:hypothetical protein
MWGGSSQSAYARHYGRLSEEVSKEPIELDKKKKKSPRAAQRQQQRLIQRRESPLKDRIQKWFREHWSKVVAVVILSMMAVVYQYGDILSSQSYKGKRFAT